MKCLLVEPIVGKTWDANQQYIGLLKIGAWLKAEGHGVMYVRGNLTMPNFVPDEIYVTSMFTYSYKSVWESVRYYKKQYPKAFVRLGGIYATLCPEHAKNSGADEVLVGQHPQAVKYFPDPTLLHPVPNFVYCMTSYGCSGNCTFCGTHILYGQGIKQRRVEDVVNELKLQKKRGFHTIFFGDDDLGYDADNHLKPLLKRILGEKLKLHFYLYGGMQARSVDNELANSMKRCGFKQVSLGWETVSDEVRRRMGRSQLGSNQVLVDAVNSFLEAGFKGSEITVFFMIGLPYQKLDDMLETLLFLAELGVWVQPQRWSPIPNTPDFKVAGLEKYDLEDLYYKKFVCPNQDSFTHEDLEDIYKIARALNMGYRMTGFPLLKPETRTHRCFIKKIACTFR